MFQKRLGLLQMPEKKQSTNKFWTQLWLQINYMMWKNIRVHHDNGAIWMFMRNKEG